MERFEAEHWSGDPPNQTVAMHDDVVQVFGLHDTDDPTNSGESENDIWTLQTSQIGAVLVDGNAVRDAVGANGALEEPARRSDVTTL